MGRRSDHSRVELEALMLEAGAAHLAEVGFARFSAREVAKRVGYSVGTLYNVFGTSDRLMLALNAGTLTRWTEALATRMATGGEDRIAALVGGYFDFAGANTHAWLALYDHHMAPDETLPTTFNAAFGGLMDLIETEVARAVGAAPGPETRTLTGSLVAIAHGHCTFAINGTSELFGRWDPRAAALARIREALAAPSSLHGIDPGTSRVRHGTSGLTPR